MRFKLEARPEPSRLMSYLSPLIAVALTLLCGLVFSLFLGQNPLATFYTNSE